MWDSWYAEHEGLHHAFFLHAPRALENPHARHHQARVGHATSPDLTSWDLHEPALEPSPHPSWDDQAIWTGCVVRGPGDQWFMYYTGISRADNAEVQRIGIATSTDLHTWTRLGDGPVLEADPRWYETDPSRTVDGVAWRDPWVFKAEDGRWHMLITASAAGHPADTGGVIGHAVSDDMVEWTALPPLTTPGRHRCLEVPQVAHIDGQHLLVFSVPRAETENDPLPLGDVWAASAVGPLGPYDIDAAWRIDDTGLYAGRLVEASPGEWALMGFINVHNDDFLGAIADPRPLQRHTIRVAVSDNMPHQTVLDR